MRRFGGRLCGSSGGPRMKRPTILIVGTVDTKSDE
ncbi:MAG: hypothetical protein RL650_2922, partial [Pseudomonadota bacterium]